jgi:UDP-GlcNAc:undecaprenyl-phosphate/decaprenyl-phosphate GlcNAc-1-phosphate transferase
VGKVEKIKTMLPYALMYLCAACAAACVILMQFAAPLAVRFRVMDIPGDRKLHHRETPLMGGITLIMAILPLSLVANWVLIEPDYQRTIFIYILTCFVIALVGIADDRHSLSARNRIILTALAFALAAISDPLFNVRILEFAITTPHIRFGLATAPVAIFFTTLCCVGLVNAINMADGKNGLVISLCIGWLSLLMTRAPAPMIPFIALLLSALIVLLISNMNGQIFLGDGGSYGFGCAIALLTIATYNSPNIRMQSALMAEEAMLLFAVPVIDSFRLTYVRLRRGQSPMAGDRDHLHHHLLNKFGWPNGLGVYLSIALLPCALLFLWRAAG